jgi:hypothetical protein
VYVKIDIRKNRRTQQKLFIICYSRQLVSIQLWGHHQVMNNNWRNEMYMEIICALRDPVQFTLAVVHTVGIIRAMDLFVELYINK